MDLKIASKIDRYFRQTWISGKIFHFVLRHEKSPGKRKKCKSKFHLKKIQKRLCTLTKAALSEIISQTAFQSFFSSSDNSTKKKTYFSEAHFLITSIAVIDLFKSIPVGISGTIFSLIVLDFDTVNDTLKLLK